MDTALLDKAIKFAVDAHAGVERRGKGFPYIVHPMEAVAVVATITADQELLAAAALHDTVEDTDVTEEQICALFGPRVANLVHLESDDDMNEEWRSRKKKAIARLAASPIDAKIVAMGDKLSNMRAIARDYRVQGDGLWTIFHAPGGKPDHEWHYRELAAALKELEGTDAYSEFTELIDKVFN
ncbi:MAG: bifunctional (p)ppGpp synthetase/guanosine-3',5'-bis(diphosphate) 3'-pyrophosphohydrolase [Bacteroidales bacterium]|nr:bifunctional (p)ppGpp synthetase/guanosine-3',5'-bis(diphosphate) 3'-pyrophosphohydrolase [Candidatus Cryptobacteroides fimicaballi]